MNNKYSLGILVAMLILLIMGTMMALSGDWWGMVPFLLGAYLATGFRILKDSPRQAGLISILGKKTSTKVEGLTLIFEPFGWRVISVVIFEIRKIDIPTFTVKNIRCSDGVTIDGVIELQLELDTEIGNRLRNFDDLGRAEGLKEIFPGLFTTALQEIATGDTILAGGAKDSTYMVGQTATVKQAVLKKLKLERRRKGTPSIDVDPTDDMSDTGCFAFKCVINLSKPTSVQEIERAPAMTRIMNERIRQRMALHEEMGTTPMPSVAQVREELIGEDVSEKGLYQKIEGGKLVNFTGPQTPRTKP